MTLYIESNEDYESRMEIIAKMNCIELNRDNINLLTQNDILFIEDDESDGSTYFIDSKINLFHIELKYNKDSAINKDFIFDLLPKYKNASFENQEDYKAINLGMGHALLIESSIYDEYIKKLKENIKYEDQFEDFYNAYCHWMKSAIKFLKEINKKNIPECPNCGKKLLPIEYGMPGPDMIGKAKNSEVFLGGCVVDYIEPIFHCNNCRRSYYANLHDYIDEHNNWDEEDIEILSDVSNTFEDADKELINYMTRKKKDLK